ncbi:MAG TPA: hypothetical protein VHM26_13190 [Chitinophagaceae bacterium]|nr:hypothetical protein [Chitinophagaceae bacterium]
MKHYIILLVTLFISIHLLSQPDQSKYHDPEFSNEVYCYRKDSATKLLRLEKGSSKMESKTKLGGMAGAENGYSIDGEESTTRLNEGKSLSFIFSTGASNKTPRSASYDSMMRANGVDPSMVEGMDGAMSDPSKTITLYKLETGKGKRKALLMKTGGALPFGSRKPKSSDKYSFSVRKIRDGYWELLIDKSLPKGEYAFSVNSFGMNNMDGSVTLFAFGVD